MSFTLARDRPFQNRDQFFSRTVLFVRNFSYGPAIVRRVRNSQSFIEDPRRDAIGMRDIRNAHPRTNCLVPMKTPVNGASHGPHRKQSR